MRAPTREVHRVTRVYHSTVRRDKRRTLRPPPPPAHSALGNGIRDRRIENARFCRQAGISQTIADFHGLEIKLVIEWGGTSHHGTDAIEYDEIRKRFFEALGLTMIRIRNESVLNDIEGVLEYVFFDSNSTTYVTPPTVEKMFFATPKPCACLNLIYGSTDVVYCRSGRLRPYVHPIWGCEMAEILQMLGSIADGAPIINGNRKSTRLHKSKAIRFAPINYRCPAYTRLGICSIRFHVSQ